ncbi:lycopene cyclase family protein [Amnibacterium kyonggiense]
MSASTTGVAGSGPRPPQRETVRIPSGLLGPVPRDAVVIAGAGCAGLAVAVALRRRGERRPIALLDARADYTDDREWCFWSTDEDPSTRLASTTWRRWVVADRTGSALRGDERTPYRMVRAADYYRDRLDALARAGGTTLHLGVRVLAERPRPGRAPELVTTAGVLHPAVLIDARGPRLDPRTARRARLRGSWLAQDFLGQWVESAEDVFDPTAAVLMDFATEAAADSTTFLYVLPVSPRRALVESVTFGAARTSTTLHRARIEAHLRRAVPGATAVRLVREERGCIPMTEHAPDALAGPDHWRVGLAGGAARPSTGYAFQRIQRSADAVAAAITTGRPARSLDPWRRRVLDRVFLRFLSDRPELAAAVFLRLFGAVDPAVVVRFLSDAGTMLDDLRIVLALPKRLFLAAARDAALHWIDPAEEDPGAPHARVRAAL